MAKESPIGIKIITTNIDLLSPKHCLLTCYLLQEKEKGLSSKWNNYIEILPKDYSNFPVFFNEEELKLLEGSPFLLQIKNKIKDIRADYDAILKV